MECYTWSSRSKFRYTGSIIDGTTIFYGKKGKVTISKYQWQKLLNHFQGQQVKIGTSRTTPPNGSMGEWVKENITKVAIMSYVGRILLVEEYGYKDKDEIKIKNCHRTMI